MASFRRAALLASGLLLAHAISAAAQTTTTYHLHAANSANPNGIGYRALDTSGPAQTGTALQSPDLKNHTGTGSLAAFETIALGLGGTIPANSTVTFSIWIKKTANFGTFDATASLSLSGTTIICTPTGPALATTIAQPVQFTCSTGSSSIQQSSTDFLRLFVGYSIVQLASHSVKVELDIDGTTDSTLIMPNPVPPHITSVTPTSGPANLSVAIAGSAFGSTQGTSTVQFTAGATATASVSAWGDASITAAVPTGLTPGAGTVTVTVNGVASNTAAFTVIPPPTLTSISPTSGHRGGSVTLTGTNFLGTQAQGSSNVTFNGVTASVTNWSDTSITATVPSTATSGSVVVQVSGQNTSGIAYTVIIPGTIAGTITQNSSGNPLSGATVQVVYQGVIKATATTPADGTYSFSNLEPATYDVRVLATGYSSEVRSVTLANGGTSTVNVAMSQPGSVTGQVTQADGITPLPGAAVTMFLNSLQQGSGNTDASGNYSITGLHPGSYTVQVVDVGYRTKEQGVVVPDGGAATANVSLDTAPQGPVSYAYDALGRLISVVDPSGDAATYTYDAVGNILSIGRIGSGTLAVTGVSPSSGAVGAGVTISGTGFSSTPAANTVSINGTSAVVTSSSLTQIVTTVPSGATSGQGQVVVTVGSASSSANFTVNAGTTAPAITGFTPPIAAAGTVVTVSGSSFDPTPANDRATVNDTFASVGTASVFSLGITVPVTAASGPISVATPYGTAVSATDLIVPPGSYGAGDVAFTSRIGFGDANALTIPINATSKIAIVLFNGVAGRRASFKLTNVSYALGSIAVVNPFNVQIAYASFTSSGGFVDINPLTVSGTYSIVIAPANATGSATLTVYDFVDNVVPIVPGGQSVDVSTNVSGQRVVLPFTATPGQRVSLQLTNLAIGSGSDCKGSLSIVDSANAPLQQNTCITGDTFLDVTPPLAPAIYRVILDPAGDLTGSARLALINVPPDFTSTIGFGGSNAVTVPIGTPGQNGALTFTATDQQRVSVTLSGGPLGNLSTCNAARILNPDGSVLVSNNCVGYQGGFIDTQTLSAGTYTIVVDPQGATTGSLTVTLNNIVDFTGALNVNDPASTVSIDTPGQNAMMSFSGASNQLVTVAMSENNLSGLCTTVTLFRQDKQTQLTSMLSCSGSFSLPQQSLPASETYYIKIDPGGPSTGTIKVRVTNP